MNQIEHPAAVDDPAWVLARYEEAKELIEDLREYDYLLIDLRRRAEDFWLVTFMDRCTTFSLNCGCERKDA